MKILTLYAPDLQVIALCHAMDASGCHSLPIDTATADAIHAADAVILLLPDYYSHAFWLMKKGLQSLLPALQDKLCACLCLCPQGCGGELALRSIVSQLLSSACLIYLSGTVCADGMIRLGGNPEIRDSGLSIMDFCTKLAHMSLHFR